MPTRVVIWGYGDTFYHIANTLLWLVEKDQVAIVGYTAEPLPPKGFIDGVPIVQKYELMQLEFDVLLMCVNKDFDKAVKSACETYKIPREKIVPWRVLQLPNFDMNDYLELKRSKISIISNLCWGGFAYHTLGLRCLSPFRNLWVAEGDFIRLLSDLKRYCTEGELRFAKMEIDKGKYVYPVMKLDDVHLHFNHVHFPDQAIREWDKRKKRINWDNLFIEMSTQIPYWAEELEKLDHFKKRICFVPYKTDLPHSFYVPLDGKGSPFYDRVNGGVLLNELSYLCNPIPLLLGRPDFGRYSE